MKQVLFLAALWGILEATLGWLFHFIHFPAGAVMFPIGLLILLAGYSIKQKRSMLLLIGLIAALIKLSNLLFAISLPVMSVYKVVNPAISIVVETLIVALFAPYVNINWEGMKIDFLRREFSLPIVLTTLCLAVALQLIL